MANQLFPFFTDYLTNNRLVEWFSAQKVKIPKHIASIMDGNGHWAQARGLPRSAGHKAGLDRIQTVLRKCYGKSVEIISVFAWSTENWSRPHREVSYIMRALEKHLPRLVKALHEENMRFIHIGSMVMI